jgi:flagellar hook assembly protein FlgD
VPNVIPVMYELSQNYPNPFNPSTTIAVDVPRNGNVRVVVYNLIGEIVATLMDGTFAPGRYEVTWSGRDDAGLQVASGMYMYRMEAGTMNIAKKMMLLK